MAPKRKAAYKNAACAQLKPKSPGKPGRKVEDLFSAAPPSKCRKTVKSLIGGVARPTTSPSISWPEFYAPKFRGELAVHKKKVEKLAEWLQAATQSPGTLPPGALCCCISGPPGSARSTTIKVLAQEYNCHVHRWAFPTPTLWSEHKHIGGESRYISKLDEFQSMVDDLKFKALTWTSTQELERCSLSDHGPSSSAHGTSLARAKRVDAPKDAGAPTISVISDFPHLHSPDARSQFCDNLMVLVQSARRPTILLVTESGKAKSTSDGVPSNGQQRTYSIEQLIVETATHHGAAHIPFNPITSRCCVRELKRIAKAEKLARSDSELEVLVQESQNDLHHAVQALQLQAVGEKPRRRAKFQSQASECSKSKEHQNRDMGLPIFHALGKILYNKRHVDVGGAEVSQAGGTGDLHSQGALNCRGPPTLSAEEVISRSGLGASVVTSFLFESYLEFVAEDSVADAAAAAENFSDAVYMLGQGASGTGIFGKQWVDPEHSTASPADAAAGTLACRGYMWANQHPAPRKWQPIRAPQIATVARAAANNRAELAERTASGRCEIEPAVMCAIQVVPYARLMAAAVPGHPSATWLPIKWRRWWAGAVIEDRGGGVSAQGATLPPSESMVLDDDPIEG